MRRLLVILLVAGILSSIGGCTLALPELLITDRTNIKCENASRNNKTISLQVKWPHLSRVYTEEEIRRRAREKVEAEGWRVSITGRM